MGAQLPRYQVLSSYQCRRQQPPVPLYFRLCEFLRGYRGHSLHLDWKCRANPANIAPLDCPPLYLCGPSADLLPPCLLPQLLLCHSNCFRTPGLCLFGYATPDASSLPLHSTTQKSGGASSTRESLP
ncbi:UNVERIFIED_CONTAM: hypothetical protein HHA_453240 [Hammondia hammondi]|eukprot:XP_008886501.1 hypothetical protein HHA_453240 [Hammondia hammondi]